ncbi:MAG: bifunctional riboflavin kinase/FAD synthetase [Candidatus Aminicenantes bacterium]|nr:MAG: bifunctional riboflavin kinase/FAD synthetase [Candidatus Aminicenantes bacterium]
MKVIHGFENFSSLSRDTVIAIGNFDGIHLGHQKILKFLAEKAKKLDLASLVLTFSPHPEKILGRARIKMLQTLDQRVQKIIKFGIQAVLVVSFDEKFSSLSSQEFIRKIVVNILRAKAVIVGENFRFGKGREGDISLLNGLASRYNFQVFSFPSVKKDNMIVSSSMIRNLLEKGKVEKANLLLGRSYEIVGKVIKGKAIGKSLGFPTANIQSENEIVPSGVFITSVAINAKTFPSLTNVGICPTFSQQETNIESFIIDFDQDVYGEKIKVDFLKKIRDEMKFATPDELSSQIKKDLETAKAYFKGIGYFF